MIKFHIEHILLLTPHIPLKMIILMVDTQLLFFPPITTLKHSMNHQGTRKTLNTPFNRKTLAFLTNVINPLQVSKSFSTNIISIQTTKPPFNGELGDAITSGNDPPKDYYHPRW